jgi:protein-tyrosine phosphatase
MAEGLLRARFHAEGVSARVGSAGLMQGGVPATPHAVTVMAERGIDLRNHLSCQLTPDIARSSNLLLGMAREHVREACVSYGALLQRSFTLKELVRRAEHGGPRREDETLYTWLARLGHGRRPADLVGDVDYDDIVDPIGRPKVYFERTADEIDDLLERLVNLMAGAERRSGAAQLRF